MENALVTIVCIALLLVGGMAAVHSTLYSVDTLSTSWKEIEVRHGEMARTEIAISETAELDLDNTLASITIANQGQEPIHNFNKWDVMLEYYDAGDVYHVVRVTHDSEPLDDNEWTNLPPTPVTFEPDILNPGEEMTVRIKLSPAIKGGTDFLVAVATPNGVATSQPFSAP